MYAQYVPVHVTNNAGAYYYNIHAYSVSLPRCYIYIECFFP